MLQLKWYNYILFIAVISSICLLLSFTSSRHNNLACKSFTVDLGNESTSLITIDEVNFLIENIVDSIRTIPIKNIPLFEIEQNLEEHTMIKNAEAYLDPNGFLKVQVQTKEPVVRVRNFDQNDFYLTNKGEKFSISKNYTPRLLMANGNIKDSLDLAQVLALSNIINGNEFLKSQIIQIYFKENKEIELIPRVGSHVFLLGTAENMEDKFDNLSLFYKSGVQQTGWNKYKEINLKYKDQIVCVKR
jgi:cell division protein FtsQ